MDIDVTDVELSKGCSEGNKKYQDIFYKKYYSEMYSTCLKYFKNKEDVEDALQEGFIRAFKYIKNFKNNGSLEGWTKKVFTNVSLNIIRSRVKFKNNINIDSYDDGYFCMNKDIIDVESDMTKSEILNIVNNLPIGYKNVFKLYEIEGYNHKEISDKLEFTPSTSKSQLSRAKKKLQEQITKLNMEKQKKETI